MYPAILLTDRLPPNVAVVALRISGRPCAVVNRAWATTPTTRVEIARALRAVGADRDTINDVMDGAHGARGVRS